jgi:hypothetical protein
MIEERVSQMRLHFSLRKGSSYAEELTSKGLEAAKLSSGREAFERPRSFRAAAKHFEPWGVPRLGRGADVIRPAALLNAAVLPASH